MKNSHSKSTNRVCRLWFRALPVVIYLRVRDGPLLISLGMDEEEKQMRMEGYADNEMVLL